MWPPNTLDWRSILLRGTRPFTFFITLVTFFFIPYTFLTPPVLAQENDVIMIGDVNTATDDASPQYITDIDGVLYFQAEDDEHGAELWTSDGTDAGTRLVADLNPGPESSEPAYLTNLNGMLLFSAMDSEGQRWLYASDGTADGTTRLTNEWLWAYGDSDEFEVVNGVAYFWGRDQEHGQELWRSDGTSAGTYMVTEIVPGSTGVEGRILAAYNNVMLMFIDGGRELWRSDGTGSGTVKIADFPHGLWGEAYELFDGRLYFVHYTENGGNQLWRTDGTTAGTELIQTFPFTSEDLEVDRLEAAGDKLYLRTNVNRGEIWVTNGTVDGATKMADFYASRLAGVGEILFLLGKDSAGTYGLWKVTDPADGIQLVRSFSPVDWRNTSIHLSDAGGMAFFTADDGVHGNEFWVSDGSAANTRLLADINPGRGDSPTRSIYHGVHATNGRVYFVAYNPYYGEELYRSGPGFTDATMVSDIRRSVTLSSKPKYFTVLGERIYFAASHPEYGETIWRADADGRNLALLEGTIPPANTDRVTFATASDDHLFFLRTDSQSDELTIVLWGVDSATGDAELLRILDEAISAESQQMAATNSALFFIDRVDGDRRLFRSDGLAANTKVISDVGGCPLYSTSKLTAAAERIYFLACDPENDATWNSALWKSDGAPENTTLIATLPDDPRAIIPSGSNVFLTIHDVWNQEQGVREDRILFSDGSTVSTVLSLPTGEFASSYEPTMAVLKGELFFFHSTADRVWDLWRVGGSSDSAQRVAAIQLPYNFKIQAMAAAENKVYFTTRKQYSVRPTQLWASDGGETGAQEFSYDFGPNPSLSGLQAVGEWLFFWVSPEEDAPWELWRTNGDPAQTQRLAQAAPFPSQVDAAAVQAPDEQAAFTATGGLGRYYFAMRSERYGDEPWVAVTPGLPIYTLSHPVSGQGDVNASPAGPYASGAVVTLTAIPADGWRFAEWRGDLTGSENPATVTIDGDKTITAVFERLEYDLAQQIQGQGTLQVTPAPPYRYGDSVTMTAVPAGGWRFTEWRDDLSGSDNPETLIMNSDKAVTAVFTEEIRPADDHRLYLPVISR